MNLVVVANTTILMMFFLMVITMYLIFVSEKLYGGF